MTILHAIHEVVHRISMQNQLVLMTSLLYKGNQNASIEADL
jgi:hypothetical protein